MYCVHIYIINRKISVTFDLENNIPVTQELKRYEETPVLSNRIHADYYYKLKRPD